MTLLGHRRRVLRPVERRSLSEAVFDQIRDHIVDGRFGPGARLPGERELATTLGVNRNALREALKRLQQLKLVAIRPGGATQVLDFRHSAGLDFFTTLIFGARGVLRADAVRSLVEMRSALGPDIAARAAMRGGPAAADELDAVLVRLEAVADDDLVARQRLSLALWRRLVAASENVAYQLAFNTMEHAWSAVQDVAASALADELADRAGYRALVRAVADGDAPRARRAAARLVAKGEAGVLRLLEEAAAKKERR
jgi:DNA-binding FadR family transcriptional regulator